MNSNLHCDGSTSYMHSQRSRCRAGATGGCSFLSKGCITSLLGLGTDAVGGSAVNSLGVAMVASLDGGEDSCIGALAASRGSGLDFHFKKRKMQGQMLSVL